MTNNAFKDNNRDQESKGSGNSHSSPNFFFSVFFPNPSETLKMIQGHQNWYEYVELDRLSTGIKKIKNLSL